MTIPNMSKMTLRPAYMAPKDGSPHWFVSTGSFFVQAAWDGLFETWMPSDNETKRAIRCGVCEFEPEFWLAHVEKPEDTIWSGKAWLTREEIDG